MLCRVLPDGEAQLLGEPVMNAVRCHESDARVPMHGVVPGEEGLAVGASNRYMARTEPR